MTPGPVFGRSRAQARWLHLLILAIPFVVVIAGWRGLTQPFPVSQGRARRGDRARARWWSIAESNR